MTTKYHGHELAAVQCEDGRWLSAQRIGVDRYAVSLHDAEPDLGSIDRTKIATVYTDERGSWECDDDGFASSHCDAVTTALEDLDADAADRLFQADVLTEGVLIGWVRREACVLVADSLNSPAVEIDDEGSVYASVHRRWHWISDDTVQHALAPLGYTGDRVAKVWAEHTTQAGQMPTSTDIEQCGEDSADFDDYACTVYTIRQMLDRKDTYGRRVIESIRRTVEAAR